MAYFEKFNFPLHAFKEKFPVAQWISAIVITVFGFSLEFFVNCYIGLSNFIDDFQEK